MRKKEDKEVIDKAIEVVKAEPLMVAEDADKESVNLASQLRLRGLQKIKGLIENETSIYNINIAVRLANDIIKESKPKVESVGKGFGLLAKMKKTVTSYQIETVQLPMHQESNADYPVDL